jgi:hypothetical protein
MTGHGESAVCDRVNRKLGVCSDHFVDSAFSVVLRGCLKFGCRLKMKSVTRVATSGNPRGYYANGELVSGMTLLGEERRSQGLYARRDAMHDGSPEISKQL